MKTDGTEKLHVSDGFCVDIKNKVSFFYYIRIQLQTLHYLKKIIIIKFLPNDYHLFSNFFYFSLLYYNLPNTSDFFFYFLFYQTLWKRIILSWIYLIYLEWFKDSKEWNHKLYDFTKILIQRHSSESCNKKYSDVVFFLLLSIEFMIISFKIILMFEEILNGKYNYFEYKRVQFFIFSLFLKISYHIDFFFSTFFSR